MRLLFLLSFALLATLHGPCVRAQTTFDADYRAPDGIYLSHQSLINEAPDLLWREIGGEVVQLPDDNRVQIEDYRIKNDLTGDPYAVSLDGNIYFLTDRNPTLRYLEFTGLEVRGPFSNIRFDTTVQTRTLMQAFNPANGQPFREAYVEREKKVTRDLVIDMQTGERHPLTSAKLIILLYADRELSSALVNTRDEERDKLQRALTIYARRNPLTLPLSLPNR